MPLQRILVVGCCGAGKSHLARALAGETGLPLIHLDREFWQPGWVELEKSAWLAKVDSIISSERWIIDGNYGGSLARRLERADAVVFLDLPRWRCMLGVLGRIARTLGRTRADMAPGCKEHLSLSFLLYVWRFHRDKRPSVVRLIERRAGWQLFTVRSRLEASQFPARFAAAVAITSPA